MAYGSYIVRLREVLQQGVGNASTELFSGGFLILTAPGRADGVVLFPDHTQPYATGISLRGDLGDVGLALSTHAPSIICTTDGVVLVSPGSNEPIAVRWFRFQ
jgi:hypothetical protein